MLFTRGFRPVEFRKLSRFGFELNGKAAPSFAVLPLILEGTGGADAGLTGILTVGLVDGFKNSCNLLWKTSLIVVPLLGISISGSDLLAPTFGLWEPMLEFNEMFDVVDFRISAMGTERIDLRAFSGAGGGLVPEAGGVASISDARSLLVFKSFELHTFSRSGGGVHFEAIISTFFSKPSSVVAAVLVR